MKTCGKCSICQPLSEFPPKRGLCRTCLRKRAARYRRDNPEKVKAWRQVHYQRHSRYYIERSKATKLRLRDWMRQLKDRPCMDCGHRFPPECMDFDHRNRKEKLFCVSRLAERGKNGTLAEIAKCDLVCANCHRIRTARSASRAGTSWSRPRSA